MRSHYFKTKNDDNGGCRGGIRSNDGEEYEVEIGSQCYCSGEMMALMIHYDEIMEYLELSNSPLAKMILLSMSHAANPNSPRPLHPHPSDSDL